MSGLTAEFILKRAIGAMVRGKRSAHCYSAHVPGKGYVNRGELESERADYLRQLERSAQSELDNLGFAAGYAEPGYTDPEHGILLANWNVFPRGIDTVLERAGYAIEWSDEWSTCADCNKAVRTSANSYSWQASYQLVNDCEVVCNNCLDWSEHIETYEDDPDRAVPSDVDPAEFGYVRVSEPREYENGFHHGQNDRPADILKALQAKGIDHVVFRIARVQQFDVAFETWRKADEDEDTNAD